MNAGNVLPLNANFLVFGVLCVAQDIINTLSVVDAMTEVIFHSIIRRYGLVISVVSPFRTIV